MIDDEGLESDGAPALGLTQGRTDNAFALFVNSFFVFPILYIL